MAYYHSICLGGEGNDRSLRIASK